MRNHFLDCDRVRSVKSVELRLPLSRAELPFEFLSDECILTSASLLVDYPEKRGRLSEAISLASSLPVLRPAVYTVLESHIDINTVDSSAIEALVRLGFEPDDFFRLHPECYLRHFTLQFFVDRPNSCRLALLRREIEKRTAAALQFLQTRSDLYGYVETEVYASSAVCASRVGTISSHCSEAIAAVFDRFHLERREISNSEVARGNELPSETVKVADLHIKFRRSEKSLGGISTDELGGVLASRGLYEIVSEAGNSIYTGQFLTASYAKRLFEALKLIVIAYDAPITVCWEPCIGFVRFGRQCTSDSSLGLPPVPPILLAAGT
jgi:hypothetical protein